MQDEDTMPASADVLYYAIKRKYVLGMQLRYNYRLYPTPGQRAALARAFGCARVVFNDGLRARQEAHAAGQPYITDGELSARLTAVKATPERAWLADVSAVVLQQSLADLNTAYRNFFASVTGKRKGPKTGPPRFKSRKDHRQAVRFTANARFLVLASGKLRLPRIGDVPVRWSRDLPSEPSSVTVIRDSAGRYFASFVIQTGPVTLPGTGPVTGIDLGLTHFAVLSDGRKIASPQFLRRAQKKLKRAQRSLSRKEKGSRNRDKARVKVARAHARVADARREFHHQLSTTLIRDNQATSCPCLAVPAVRGVAGPGHQRGGQRRQGRRTGGDSLQSAGKTRAHPGAARRSRNPPEATPGSGVTGGKLRPSERNGGQSNTVRRRWTDWSRPIAIMSAKTAEPP
jgi:putative transposase